MVSIFLKFIPICANSGLRRPLFTDSMKQSDFFCALERYRKSSQDVGQATFCVH